MEQKLCRSKLQSHPGKPLNLHLLRVATNCKNLLNSKKLNFSDYLDTEILSKLAYLIGATHDFGKATKYFQEYLSERDEDRKKKLKAQPETKHGLLSAIFTYYVVKNFIKKQGFVDAPYSLLPILSFLIVKRHHGNLRNGLDEINNVHEILKDKKWGGILRSQLNSIDEAEMINILEHIVADSEVFTNFKEKFPDVLKEIDKEYTALLRLKRKNTIFFYFLTLFLYSILIDSDKAEAMEIPTIERENILSNIVDAYKRNEFDSPKTKIDQIREEIYQEVNRQVERVSFDDKIFSLNVPTGTGKTLTSLSFALKLKDRIEKERGFKPRIIYSLPFLSIIDQNFSIFEDVLSKQYGTNIPTNILLKHHHLSEIFYETADDEFSTDKSQFLIESWNSEIVVTSFIQLFHSIISNKNRSIRKFHNIVNAIVLLDEIQTIPHEYWHLLNQALTFLSKHFNVYFVIITATEPLIFDEAAGEIKPLVKNKQKYFEEFDRISLNLMFAKETSIEDFKKILLSDLNSRKDKDFLIVMNTIDSSKEVFRFLRDNLKDNSNEFFYLSTNIVPIERLERINRIKNAGERKIIVSTQLIEAGVDIDVDVIYRDFSPLDSINQVAGRCNRNYKEETKGEVNIYILKDDRTNRFFYNYIYDGFLINKTKEVFGGINKIEERSFLKLNNEYFEKVKHTSSNDESNRILENLYKLAFKETGDFKLIKEDYEKVDIFVELNAEARKIWDTFSLVVKEDDIKKRRKNFLEIKKEFYSYIISIPKEKVGSICIENGIGHIQISDLQRKYDKETGFISEGGVLII